MNDLLTDPCWNSDVENGKLVSDMGMEAFKDQIKEVDNQEEQLAALLKKLKDTNQIAKTITKASAMKEIKKEMEKDVNEAGNIARGIKATLEEINRDNIGNRLRSGCEKGTAVDRSRINMTNAVANKFKDLVADFQVLRQRMHDEHREIVERRVILVIGTIPDEKTIDKLIETGNSEQLFEKALQGMGRGQVLDTLEEIQERHDVIKDMEKKLLELQQIYLDLAILVESQCEILDNIEIQVSSATEHFQRGVTALQIAKKQQKCSKKWICSAFIMLLLLAAVIFGFMQPWKRQ